MAEDKAAFGVFPHIKVKHKQQDREAAKGMPLAAARGFVAGTLGLPSDIINLGGILYSLTTGQPVGEVPYGSEHWKETLPLKDETPAGQAATELGSLFGGAGMGRPVKGALSMAKKVPRVVGEGLNERLLSGQSLTPFLNTPAPIAHVIKPKGGNWMTGSVEKELNTLKRNKTAAQALEEMGKVYPADVMETMSPETRAQVERAIPHLQREAALNNWVDRNLTNFIKKEMATPEDPVRKLAEQGITHYPVAEDPGYWARHGATAREERGGEAMAQSPLAKQWENRTDAMIDRDAAQVHQDMMHLAPGMYSDQDAWIKKLDPSTQLYSAHSRHFSPLDLGFDHILDVLREDLASGRIRPEQLNKVSMEQAVRRTYEYDQELAKKMAEARAASREGLPVYKEYPEGFRWVELNKPGAFATESEAMGHSVRGYEPPKGHADWIESSGDSGSHGYGHGGWEAIKSGAAKVYSLVDPKGNPHVTVELGQMPYYERKAAEMKRNGASNEEIAAFFENPPMVITQVKGKQNAAPKEEYLPFVQDFVRSSGMPVERDLQNTGLHKFGSEYLTPQEAETKFKPMVSDALNYLETHPSLERHRAARQARNDFRGDLRSPEYRQLEKQAGESIAPDVPYTYAELKALLSSPEDWTERGDTIYTPISTALEQIERAKQHLGPLPPAEGMKRGGKVHISDNPDTQMMELAGGGEVRMQDGGTPKKKVIGDFWSGLRESIPGKSELGPIDALKQNLSAMYEGAQKIPGNLYNLATNPVEYIKNLPVPTGEQIINAAGPSDMGFVGSYKPHTPLKPDPTVGSRYKTQHVGALAPKKPFDIEKEQGSSIMSNPWDLTSRGEKVLEVSDVPLANPIVTEGGHDFARDLGHIASNIGGASGPQIAKRMQDRVNDAYFANMLEKGTGRVFTMPSTMDVTASNYSTMPVDIAMDLLSQAGLKSKDLHRITNDIQTFMFEGEKGKFKNAAPVGTPEFLRQLREGGKGFSAGDLRKGVMDRLSKSEYQKLIGFNIEDIYGAIHDPSLKGFPKGFVGNTMIETVPFADLSKAKHQSYETANAGKYAGSLPSMPVELMMPDLYQYFEAQYLAQPKYQKLTPNQLRTTIVNTIEKKGSIISQPINQRVVDNVMRYKEGLKQGHFDPKDYNAVMDYMRRTGGYKDGGEVQKSVGGSMSKAALNAMERLKELKAEAALKSDVWKAKQAADEGKYTQDIQAMTPEMMRAEIERMQNPVKKAAGGEITADDLILEERPL